MCKQFGQGSKSSFLKNACVVVGVTASTDAVAYEVRSMVAVKCLQRLNKAMLNHQSMHTVSTGIVYIHAELNIVSILR